MPSFNQQIDKHGQFIIGVKVFPSAQNEEEFNKTAKSATGYRALVDTGANNCCISEKIVANLKLQTYSKTKMITAGSPYITSLYRVAICIPVFELYKGFPDIKVSAVPDIGKDRGFDVILGMNMLFHFHITMHQGQIIISI